MQFLKKHAFTFLIHHSSRIDQLQFSFSYLHMIILRNLSDKYQQLGLVFESSDLYLGRIVESHSVSLSKEPTTHP